MQILCFKGREPLLSIIAEYEEWDEFAAYVNDNNNNNVSEFVWRIVMK